MSVHTLGAPGSYFATSQEADEWLDFEATPDEREAKFQAENDRYHEWERWRAAWFEGL